MKLAAIRKTKDMYAAWRMKKARRLVRELHHSGSGYRAGKDHTQVIHNGGKP